MESFVSVYPRTKRVFLEFGIRKQAAEHFGRKDVATKMHRAITSMFIGRFSKFFFPMKAVFIQNM